MIMIFMKLLIPITLLVLLLSISSVSAQMEMIEHVGYDVWFYVIGSVIIVSLIALIGIVALSVNVEKLKSILIYLVSFSAGALFGDAFLHLLPHTVEEFGFTVNVSMYLLSGIILFFVLEKIVHWRHCHLPDTKDHVHPFAYTNLIGDALHNFIDGLIIAVSYLISIPVGIATTIAVILHEIPQEIGDFGVLIHAGFTRKRALFVNFLSAITAIIGAIIALSAAFMFENITVFLVPLAAGGFIYIAGSDLIPELHKETRVSRSLGQLVLFLFGILVMLSLMGLE
ncbi:MAG: ZIP family metal transporter [Candidatus Aenigmatarchaeota archaeon]